MCTLTATECLCACVLVGLCTCLRVCPCPLSVCLFCICWCLTIRLSASVWRGLSVGVTWLSVGLCGVSVCWCLWRVCWCVCVSKGTGQKKKHQMLQFFDASDDSLMFSVQLALGTQICWLLQASLNVMAMCALDVVPPVLMCFH